MPYALAALYSVSAIISSIAGQSQEEDAVGKRKARKGEHPEVAIIGAGVGGLATAIRLAAAGCRVQIF